MVLKEEQFRLKWEDLLFRKNVGGYARSSDLRVYHEVSIEALGLISVYQFQQFRKDARLGISALDKVVRHD